MSPLSATRFLRLPIGIVFCVAMVSQVLSASAQTLPLDLPMPLVGVSSYDASIPKPEDVIGHRIGTRHTTPDQVVSYFEAVAAVSNRITLQRHGRTYEGRPLIHATVTSPSNHGRLEQIRLANVKLVEDPNSVSDSDLESMPAIFYAGYSIHGNEATGTEAAVLFLYHLAAGKGPAVEQALENTVILLDPMFNPDGRDRFADWVNRYRGAVATTDTQDMEHREPWPGGRTNHYFFDLNRDWLPAQQVESQGRLEVFHSWKPQVLTDHHEMGAGSTFFFQPGIPSRTNPNTPARNQELTGMIGEYHAEILDSYGALYYTQQSFDDFYYGKGSTYPDINGAIGILFEQASSRALETATDAGVLTYAYGVRNQFAASLSSLKAIGELRVELLKHQRDFYKEVPNFAKALPISGYLISTESRHRATLLAEILERHKIKMYDIDKDLSINGKTFRKGASMYVPLDQTQGRLLKGMMETSDTFTDSLFYDVSSWTLPLAFNLDYVEVPKSRGSIRGAELSKNDVRSTGRVIGGRASYAYVVEWGEYYLPKALNEMLAAGVRMKVMHEPFSSIVDGAAYNFPRGSVIIPVHQQGVDAATIHALVASKSADEALTFRSVSTGLTPIGPDLGSDSAVYLPEPSVAILAEGRQSSSVVGEAWQVLSEHLRMPVSLVSEERIGSIDLTRYNVIVASGSVENTDAIKGWVRSGGVLITLGGATSWAAQNGLADLKRRDFDTDSLYANETYATIGEARGAQSLGGAIVESVVDVTNPIMYGVGPRLPVFVRGTTVFDKPTTPGTNAASYSARPELSGYFSDPHRKLLPNGMAVSVFSSGRGRVVAFATDPNFRQFWYGTSAVFVNAVFLGATM